MTSHSGLVGFITGLGRPPTKDSDAELLDRFAKTADDAAFTGLVHRHGLMVLAVCRRRLRREADAEDAFQAVFLALARSARLIARGESLPGWLYRVAYLISLKAAGMRARHSAEPWPEIEIAMPVPSLSPAEAWELKTTVDAELANLPDRFRAVAVLCLIEGRSNVEAASLLGVPVGTVDSRLHTARKRLCSRLLRRGATLGVGASLSELLGGPLSASEGISFQTIVSNTVRGIVAEIAAPGTISPAVANLAKGMTMMTMTRLRLIAAAGIAVGLLGGTATGIYLATAADPPQAAAEKQAKNQKTPDTAKQIENKLVDFGKTETVTEDDLLQRPVKILGDVGEKVALGDLLGAIGRDTGLIVRVDIAAFKRMGIVLPNASSESYVTFQKDLFEQAVSLPGEFRKLPLMDMLSDTLAQISLGSGMCSYQLRGRELVIIPAYQPPGKPGVDPIGQLNEDEALVLPTRTLFEQIYGGIVRVSAAKKPFNDILADLQKQTGANIVIDPRCEAQMKGRTLTLSLNDVRLYDALRFIADLAELKMVYAGNIYYITTPENAKTFQPSPQLPSPTTKVPSKVMPKQP